MEPLTIVVSLLAVQFVDGRQKFLAQLSCLRIKLPFKLAKLRFELVVGLAKPHDIGARVVSFHHLLRRQAKSWPNSPAQLKRFIIAVLCARKNGGPSCQYGRPVSRVYVRDPYATALFRDGASHFEGLRLADIRESTPAKSRLICSRSATTESSSGLRLSAHYRRRFEPRSAWSKAGDRDCAVCAL